MHPGPAGADLFDFSLFYVCVQGVHRNGVCACFHETGFVCVLCPVRPPDQCSPACGSAVL